jgi:glutathione S-transferase
MKPFPDQPLFIDEQGTARFQQNAIVRYLLDAGPFDMNKLAVTPFTEADRAQFAQLIGYSLGGYSELSYVSDALYARAANANPIPDEPPEPTRQEQVLALINDIESAIEKLQILMREE